MTPRGYEGCFGVDEAGLDAVPANPTLDLLDHRIQRAFTARTVPESAVVAVLAAPFPAPSKSDLQQTTAIRMLVPAHARAGRR